MTCSVEGCAMMATSRGWCQRHYMVWYNGGGSDLINVVDIDACGAGTDGGCGRRVDYPAVLVVNARPVIGPRGPMTDNGHVLFHPACKPEGTRPAFMAGLMAEIRARA